MEVKLYLLFLNKENDMSTLEIKKNIVDKLERVEDTILLDEIYRLLNINSDVENKYVFSEQQLSVLNERNESINKGDFLTDEEADKDLKEWLKK